MSKDARSRIRKKVRQSLRRKPKSLDINWDALDRMRAIRTDVAKAVIGRQDVSPRLEAFLASVKASVFEVHTYFNSEGNLLDKKLEEAEKEILDSIEHWVIDRQEAA